MALCFPDRKRLLQGIVLIDPLGKFGENLANSGLSLCRQHLNHKGQSNPKCQQFRFKHHSQFIQQRDLLTWHPAGSAGGASDH